METTNSKPIENEEAKMPVNMTEAALGHLDDMRKWSLFIAIVGFLSFLMTFAAGFLYLNIPADNPMAGTLHLVSAFCFIIGILGCIPMYFLVKTSASAKKAVRERSETDLEASMKYLKYHYICVGLFGILMVVLLVASLAAAILSGLFLASSQTGY
jgi:hypothetical protein